MGPDSTTREQLVRDLLACYEGFPVSTADIAKAISHYAHVWVLPTLHRLAKAGEIQLIKPEGSRANYWRI